MKTTMEGSPYGLFREEDLGQAWVQNNDLSLGKSPWAVAGSFRDQARNHCAATLVTNLALCFSRQGYDGLLVHDDLEDTFWEVHAMVGNGPVPMVGTKAKEYFARRGYVLQTRPVMTYRRLKKAVDQGYPLGLLLTESFQRWHWVLAIGYGRTGGNGKYIRIVDGWHPRGTLLYRIHKGSFWWSATEYRILKKITHVQDRFP